MANDRRRCDACDMVISSRAIICLHCGSFRAVWKNELRYWSGVVGLFAFIGSAGLFASEFVKTELAQKIGGDIEILNMDTFGELTVFNNSPTDILIRDVLIKTEKTGLELLYTIDRSVEPGATFSGNMIEILKRQTHGYWTDRYGNSPGNYKFNMDQKEADCAIDFYPNKYLLAFLNRNGSSHKFFSDASRGYKDVQCTATLTYTVHRGGVFPEPISCVAWFREYHPESKHKPDPSEVECPKP